MITRITVILPSQLSYNREALNREQKDFTDASNDLTALSIRLSEFEKLIADAKSDSQASARALIDKHFPEAEVKISSYGKRKTTFSFYNITITENY